MNTGFVFLTTSPSVTSSSGCFVSQWQPIQRRHLPPVVVSSCGATTITFSKRGTRCAAIKSRPVGGVVGDSNHEKGSSLIEEVRSSRRSRQTGLLIGSTFLSIAVGVGVAAGVLDSAMVGVVIASGMAWFLCNTLSYNEASPPLPDSLFDVRESQIPNAGNGLFALQPIAQGTYLMDYEGEVLTETEYFLRYPDGQGRYVAGIPEPLPLLPDCGPAAAAALSEPTYIDGSDPTTSNLARYMNSAPPEEKNGANVVWKKQRFGVRSMHFYALRAMEAGEELCFDYGANYWDAITEKEKD
eukprot:scaffold53609_cov58-Attheya_sp.AAC.2